MNNIKDGDTLNVDGKKFHVMELKPTVGDYVVIDSDEYSITNRDMYLGQVVEKHSGYIQVKVISHKNKYSEGEVYKLEGNLIGNTLKFASEEVIEEHKNGNKKESIYTFKQGKVYELNFIDYLNDSESVYVVSHTFNGKVITFAYNVSEKPARLNHGKRTEFTKQYMKDNCRLLTEREASFRLNAREVGQLHTGDIVTSIKNVGRVDVFKDVFTYTPACKIPEEKLMLISTKLERSDNIMYDCLPF